MIFHDSRLQIKRDSFTKTPWDYIRIRDLSKNILPCPPCRRPHFPCPCALHSCFARQAARPTFVLLKSLKVTVEAAASFYKHKQEKIMRGEKNNKKPVGKIFVVKRKKIIHTYICVINEMFTLI